MAAVPPFVAVATFERHRAELIRARRGRTVLAVVLLFAALAVSIDVAQFFPARLAAGLPRFGEYLWLTVPNLDAARLLDGVKEPGSLAYWYFNLAHYLRLIFETLNMALLATLVGFALGALLSFPASRNLSPHPVVYAVTRRILEFARGVPDIVFALILVWAFGIGPLAGIVAIAVHQAGVLGKLFAEANENAAPGPIEGVRATGGSWAQELRFGLLPQVTPSFAAYGLWRLEVAIRSSSVIGFVGGGGVGQELNLVIVRNYYEEVSALVLLIVLATTLVDLLSARLRHRLIGTGRTA